MSRLTKDLERTCETNTDVKAYFQGQLQNIESRFGADCDLLKQLAASKKACGNLHEKLDFVAPNFYTLDAAIRDREEKELSLLQQMEGLGRELLETRNAVKEPPPHPEDGNISTVVSELTVQLEKMSQELKNSQEGLRTRNMEHENTKLSLLETSEMLKAVEARAAQHENEVAALQQRNQAIESKIREELNRASVISRDQSRANFEQKLHGILREKTVVEKELQKANELLVSAQQSQVKRKSLISEPALTNEATK